MRAFYLLILISLFAASCKEENNNKFTLNYFIDMSVLDTSTMQVSVHNSSYLDYIDTFTHVTKTSIKLIHEYNLLLNTKFILILPEVPTAIGNGNIISPNSLLSDTAFENYSLSIESAQFKSIAINLNDSSVNIINKIEKANESTYIIHGGYRTWCVGSDSIYRFVQGVYKLPYYIY